MTTEEPRVLQMKIRKIKLSANASLTCAGIAAMLLVGLVVWGPWRTDSSSHDTTVTPNFQSLTPRGSEVSKLGGWQKLTPPDGSSVYVYSDTIDTVSISVSQQPLPHTFKANIATNVADLAKGYNATTTLDANGVKAYIGTSGDGPQSVIFTKNDLLVLIKSRAVIKNESWTSYIRSLE